MNAFQILTTFLVVLVIVAFMVHFMYARWNAPCPECDARMGRDLFRPYDADEVRLEKAAAASEDGAVVDKLLSDSDLSDD
jgi:hypothetical protein